MRNAIFAVVVALIAVTGASLAYAQAPVDGTWKSTDSDFLEGRQSTSWAAAGGRLTMLNTLNAASWDGAGTLGSDWVITCPYMVNVVPTSPPVVTGNETYLVIYTGGTVVLDGGGPWGGGDPSYTGTITTYIENRAVQKVAGVVVGTAETHSMSADVVGYAQSCIAFGIGNGAWEGDTDASVFPANYPALTDFVCAAGPVLGRWGQVTNITLTVKGCIVGVEESTWGSVKSLYTE